MKQKSRKLTEREEVNLQNRLLEYVLPAKTDGKSENFKYE